jgi:hypothetical protein
MGANGREPMNSSRSGWRIGGFVCLLGLELGLTSHLARAPLAEPGPVVTERMRDALAGVAVPFIANAGQTDEAVAFYASTFAGKVFVTRDGDIVYSLPGKDASSKGRPLKAASAGWSLTEAPVGTAGETRPRPVARKPAPTQVSYFLGNDPSARTSGVSTSTYDEVSLGEVWPGVDVSLRARGKNVEKIFTVRPGADPSRIRMRVTGAWSLAPGRTGDLVAATGIGEVILTRPVAFQERDGARRAIAVAYEARGDTYEFRLGAYDAGLPLVIDPLLQATYLGGSGSDLANALVIHPASGDVYVAGNTGSTNFPGTAGGARTANAGGSDTFVARLSADLKTLTQATYLGGSGDDLGYALAIDPASGDVYVGGVTTSTNFPGTAGGAQPAGGGSSDSFVARLTADLKTLTQATYLGGSSHDTVLSLAIRSGSVYAAGWTQSPDLPGTAGGMQTTFGGGFFDAFIVRLTTDLKTRTQATYLGTAGDDQALALAIHPTSGDIYVAGYTSSTNFNGGSTDAFVALLTADLKTLTRATLLGGSGDERAQALAIDPTSGDVYAAGNTSSTNFPGTTGGAQPASGGGGNDAFVARLTADLTALTKATYLGGGGSDAAQSLAIHPTSGDVYVAGSTTSTNFPKTSGGAQPVNGGGNDAFVARLSADLTSLIQTTYLGGSGTELPEGFAIHPTSSSVYVAGFTSSTNLPGTTGGARPANGGGNDAFVARLTSDLASTRGPTSLYTVPLCRILDTRNPVGPYGGPAIAAGADRTFVVAGRCGIPATAIAVTINVTVTSPTAAGDLRLYPGGNALPLASTINYRPGQTRANDSIASLGGAGDLAVHCDQASGTVQLIVDVSGYLK